MLAVVVASVLLMVRLQTYAVTLREREKASRWASNLRDLVNLGGGVLMFVAFRLAGHPSPAAVLFGGTMVVILEAARQILPKQRVPASLVAGLSFALPSALFPVQAVDAANRLVALLFP